MYPWQHFAILQCFTVKKKKAKVKKLNYFWASDPSACLDPYVYVLKGHKVGN